jgi:hypothetical protein
MKYIPPKCENCGKFVNLADDNIFSYTPFGSVTDYEPPEPRYLCCNCLEKMKPESKSYLESAQRVWIPLHKVQEGVSI